MPHRASLLAGLAIVWIAVGVIGVIPALFGEVDGAIVLMFTLAFVAMIPTFMFAATLCDANRDR